MFFWLQIWNASSPCHLLRRSGAQIAAINWCANEVSVLWISEYSLGIRSVILSGLRLRTASTSVCIARAPVACPHTDTGCLRERQRALRWWWGISISQWGVGNSDGRGGQNSSVSCRCLRRGREEEWQSGWMKWKQLRRTAFLGFHNLINGFLSAMCVLFLFKNTENTELWAYITTELKLMSLCCTESNFLIVFPLTWTFSHISLFHSSQYNFTATAMAQTAWELRACTAKGAFNLSGQVSALGPGSQKVKKSLPWAEGTTGDGGREQLRLRVLPYWSHCIRKQQNNEYSHVNWSALPEFMLTLKSKTHDL